MSGDILKSLGKFKPERPVSEVQTRTTFENPNQGFFVARAQTRAPELHSPGLLDEEVSAAEELGSVSLKPGDLAHHLHTLSKSEVLGSADPAYVCLMWSTPGNM